VAEWLKQPGEFVEVGEVICLIEGDKSTSELEAEASGRLHVVSSAHGPEVPVGTPIAYLLAAGEAPPSIDGGEPRVVSTPRARRAAKALGVDWRTVAGTGRGGRILERDVQRAALAAQETESPEDHVVAQGLHGIRRVTAERLAQSARAVVPVTLTTEADATTLSRLRDEAAGADPQTTPSITDLFVKIVGLSLSDHPALNASFTATGIVQHAAIHIAITVDTPHGLLAPVIRDAASRSVHAITLESRRLLADARAGRLAAADQHEATFTISNLGMFDIDAFTPVVNLPQCAILGIGRIVARAVVTDQAAERIQVRRMVALSLTFDHRLVDGAPAARFLQRVKNLVEQPSLWLFR
jgi:pyruvate dehydrogenase E2 component (dihydrolipoamide acetyltransferase)